MCQECHEVRVFGRRKGKPQFWHCTVTFSYPFSGFVNAARCQFFVMRLHISSAQPLTMRAASKEEEHVVSLCLSRELSNMCFEHFVLSAKDKDLRSLDAVVNN
jgi:hypothetical protein